MSTWIPTMNRQALERNELLEDARSQYQISNSAKRAQEESKLLAWRQELARLPASVPPYLYRKQKDLKKEIEKSLMRIQELDTLLQTSKERFVHIEKKYSKALEKAQVHNGLISSSIQSASKTFRRSNVVLMSPDNAEECIRQHMRAELGLQELPLMLTAGDVCDDCGVQMSVVSNDSMLSCSNCHKLRLLPNTMTTSALHGTDIESATVITKHRLPEWIEMAQGKEFAEPPPDIVKDVANFLIRHRMTGLEDYMDMIKEERKRHGPFRSVHDAKKRLPDIPDLLQRLLAINASNVRTALRGLVTEGKGEKYRRFYEKSAKVGALVSGFWPARMTGQQEELLRMLYTTAAPQYEKRRKPKQTYWPGGFPFFLRCLCVLLGWDEFAAQFPIPAGSKEGGSRDLLRNEIWTELGWELVPYTGKIAPIMLPDGSRLCTTLDEEESNNESASDARHMQKDVEAKLSIKKRGRLDFELQCS